MNVGFYFHIPFSVDDDGTVRVQRSIGSRIADLARTAGHVTFYGHRYAGSEVDDFVLPAELVTTIDLGPLRSAPARTFLPRRELASFTPRAHGVDVMLIQGATPLLPHLASKADVPCALFLVADYATWGGQEHFAWWRNALIKLWAKAYVAMQKRASSGRVVILQDPSLSRSVRNPMSVEVVFTPSLGRAALQTWGSEPRPASANGGFTLLYPGRIVREKGIFEAVSAVEIVSRRGIDVHLQLMGWEEPGSNMIAAVLDRARDLGIADRVSFIGYRTGQALLDAYAHADACVIPTYWESFPRAAHEAMALGVPLIATNVGGLPHYLADGETALLVPPRDDRALAGAVARLSTDTVLRERIGAAGRAWAVAHTREASIGRIVQIIGCLVPEAST